MNDMEKRAFAEGYTQRMIEAGLVKESARGDYVIEALRALVNRPIVGFPGKTRVGEIGRYPREAGAITSYDRLHRALPATEFSRDAELRHLLKRIEASNTQTGGLATAPSGTWRAAGVELGSETDRARLGLTADLLAAAKAIRKYDPRNPYV